MRFLQVWLIPNVDDATPRYDTLDIAPRDKDGQLKLKYKVIHQLP